MAATKSFEDGLREVEEKLEEIFTRFQKCCTQVRQEFSLKVFKSEKEKKSKLIQAAVKEKKNRERQDHSYGLQQNRCYKRRMDAKLFWKKFVVASQPTKKLWISLGKRFERLSFQEQPHSNRVPRGPWILRRTWDPGIKIVQSNTLRTRVQKKKKKKLFISYCSSKKKKPSGDLEGMAATKSFEDGLREVEEKLEEIFTRFQKCCTQVRQEFSLKVFKSVEVAEKEKKSKLIQAAVKEKKNRERQDHSYGLQQNR
nr:hypothetical protein [Tanacetum cinerariifolium]